MTKECNGVNPRALVILLLISAALLALTLSRLQLTYDLSFFLPTPQDDAQRLLVERLGQGPGTQLVFVTLSDTDENTARSAAAVLRNIEGVAKVLPEEQHPEIAQLPAAIWQNRLLLADLPQSKNDWLAVLDERMGDVMLADDDLQDLIAGDPALLSLSAIEQATSATSSPQFIRHSNPATGTPRQHILLVQTRTGAFDLDSQNTTIRTIRTSLHDTGINKAKLYGSGVYGVDLQASVQRESIIFSVLASLALAALVFARFRRWQLVLAIGVPLIVGGLAGLTALALLFDKVHGITLAFGFTLLGVAIDYPLHLFSHATSAGQSHSVWPTLRLGIGSTLVAYLAFASSGTAGMQQLGVFAATGIVVAALASWWLSDLPNTALKVQGSTFTTPNFGRAKHWPWCLCLLISAPLLPNSNLFSNDLSRMTPVPEATLEEDARIRQAMGVADLRHVVSVRHDNLQGVLERLEQTNIVLKSAVARGEIDGFQNISPLLPSDIVQQRRRQAARQAINNRTFAAALTDSGFASNAFTDFESALTALADPTAAPLELDMLRDSSPELADLVDSMLYQSDDQWIALTFLRGFTPSSASPVTEAFAEQFQGVEGTALVDLKQASMRLVADYRTRVFKLLAGALVVIAMLLLIATRQPSRVIWLLGTLLAALVISIGVGRLFLGGLSLFDVIALTLVAGLGLDYALFFSKPSDNHADRDITRRAITLCALSSLFVFGVLALSSIPLLHGLGITVASGVAAAWLLARFGWQAGPSKGV